MSLPARDEVPLEERWDPALVFDSRDDWEAATEAFADRLDDLREFEGRTIEDGETLLATLDLIEELQVRRLGSIHLYPFLRGYVDTTDEDAREMRGRYCSLRAEMESVLGRLRTELVRADRDRVDDLVAETPGLASHEAHLDRLLADADHLLDPETEAALADLGPVFETGTRVGRAIGDGDVDPPAVELPDGESVTVTRQRRSKLLRHSDREVRKAAYERSLDALADHRHGMAAAYVGRVRADCRLARVRGYDSALAMRLAGADGSLGGPFPVEAYETVIDGVLNRLDPHHRLLSARRERLGLDDLRAWDRQIPLVAGDPPTVSYEAATDLILDSLEPLGEDYVDRLAGLLAERRVDVRQTVNKRTGPFAVQVSSVEDGPFVALNFDGSLREVLFFTHELGHAMNRQLASDDQRLVDQGVPEHTGEVASFLHEALLVDHLTDAWDGDDARHARAAFLDKLPLYRAAAGARFVHGLHEAVAGGADPGPDALDERYREAVSETVDGPVASDEWTGAGWQLVDTGRDPYHAYRYAVGSVGALAVGRALRDGDLSAAGYREMLSRGRSVRSNEAFGPVLDFTDEATVEAGVREFADRADALLDGR